jgi:hypothetical protein
MKKSIRHVSIELKYSGIKTWKLKDENGQMKEDIYER